MDANRALPDFLEYAISVLAVWRISVMLVKENGPAHSFDRLRAWLGIGYDDDGNSAIDTVQSRYKVFFAELLSCVNCVSVWVALLFTVLAGPPPLGVFLAYWFSLSAISILIDKAFYG